MPDPGEIERAVAVDKCTQRIEPTEQPHRDLTGEVIIACAQAAHVGVPRTRPGSQMTDMGGEAEHRFDQTSGFVIGEAEIAVPPL